MLRFCKKHGEGKHYPQKGTNSFRCNKCSVESVTKRRRKVKSVIVAEAGGKCIRRSYSKYQGALHFHHRDPSDKSFNISTNVTMGIDRLRAEAAKCDVLCANCHAEVEAGM